MKKYRMNIFCLLFLLILFSAALLFTKNNVSKEAGSININAGVQDAINNLDQYADYFKDMKPDWGDYLQADLDIKKIISKEELKELYCTAEQMKEMINNEYMRQNLTK